MTRLAQPLQVERALHDVAALVAERAAQKGLTVSVRVQPETPVLALEEPTFKTISYDLLECAVTFAPEAGEILVAAGPAPRRASGDDAIVVVVSENGSAGREVDAERLARSYEHFDQPGRLASTRELVEALGGRLWVTTKAGKGNALTFVLPAGRPVL